MQVYTSHICSPFEACHTCPLPLVTATLSRCAYSGNETTPFSTVPRSKRRHPLPPPLLPDNCTHTQKTSHHAIPRNPQRVLELGLSAGCPRVCKRPDILPASPSPPHPLLPPGSPLQLFSTRDFQPPPPSALAASRPESCPPPSKSCLGPKHRHGGQRPLRRRSLHS